MSQNKRNKNKKKVGKNRSKRLEPALSKATRPSRRLVKSFLPDMGSNQLYQDFVQESLEIINKIINQLRVFPDSQPLEVFIKEWTISLANMQETAKLVTGKKIQDLFEGVSDFIDQVASSAKGMQSVSRLFFSQLWSAFKLTFEELQLSGKEDEGLFQLHKIISLLRKNKMVEAQQQLSEKFVSDKMTFPDSENKADNHMFLASPSSLPISPSKIDMLTVACEEILQEIRIYNEKFQENRESQQFILALQNAVSRLKDEIRGLRLFPLQDVTYKLPRFVRDLANEFKKEISLSIEGEAIKADRLLFSVLEDILIHLIRNACDHGIELPEERRKNCKSLPGQISIKFLSSDSEALRIEIFDDGEGIDHTQIMEKAIETGLLQQQQLIKMTRDEVLELIFKPGLSTAPTISQISGRGIGMDLVLNHVQKIGGKIHLWSEKGRGTKFIIQVPRILKLSDLDKDVPK